MKRIILILIILIPALVSAQFENTDIGARPISLNGAFTSLADNSLSIFYNPAGLGQMKFREFSAFYSPAPFGLTDLSTAAITYAEPFKFGTIGAAFRTYGFDLYRENQVFVSYGNDFKDRIFYGVNLNFYNLNIKNYNSASAFGLDIGVMAYLTKFLQFGFIGKNLTGSKIGESKEKITQVYRTGLTYQPINNLRIIGEIEKDIKYPVSVKAGVEYNVIDYIDLRFGVGNQPGSSGDPQTIFAAGVGFGYKIFTFDYAFNKSADLGFTHVGSVTINFGGIEGKKLSRERLMKSFE